MEDPVAVALKHLGMNVEARVAKLCDFLGQQLHTVHRVAEDYGLVDLQLQDCSNNSFTLKKSFVKLKSQASIAAEGMGGLMKIINLAVRQM